MYSHGADARRARDRRNRRRSAGDRRLEADPSWCL